MLHQTPSSTAIAFALAAALMALPAPPTANAQSSRSPVSTRRIKVKKEKTDSAAGTVALPPARDTVTRAVVVDTTTPVPKPVPVDTTTVVQTTIVPTTPDTTSAYPRPVRMGKRYGSFYIGLAGGGSVPSGDIYNGYNPGFNITVPMGWQPQGSIFGLRFDLSYDRFMSRATFRNNGQTTALVTTGAAGGYTVGSVPAPSGTGNGTTTTGTTGSTGTAGAGTSGYSYSGIARVANMDPSLASAMLDAKLLLPFLGRHSSTGLYAVGGGGVHYFFHYDQTFALTNPGAEQAKFAQLHQATAASTTNGTYSTSSTNYGSSYGALTRLGANAGLGLQWGMGGADMFIEGRYVTVFTKDRSTNYWPIMIGVNLR